MPERRNHGRCTNKDSADPRQRAGHGLFEVTAQQMRRIGYAIGMGGNVAFEDIDIAAGEKFAQMGIGAAIAEAKLQYRAVHASNQPSRYI